MPDRDKTMSEAHLSEVHQSEANLIDKSIIQNGLRQKLIPFEASVRRTTWYFARLRCGLQFTLDLGTCQTGRTSPERM